MNGLSGFIETYNEYLIALADDWRSKCKVTAVCPGGVGIRVDDVVSKSVFWFLLYFSKSCQLCVSLSDICRLILLLIDACLLPYNVLFLMH